METNWPVYGQGEGHTSEGKMKQCAKWDWSYVAKENKRQKGIENVSSRRSPGNTVEYTPLRHQQMSGAGQRCISLEAGRADEVGGPEHIHLAGEESRGGGGRV